MPIQLSQTGDGKVQVTDRNGIEYVEMPGSPDENFADDDVHVTRKLACLWSDRLSFWDDMLGWSEHNGTSSVLTRYLPQKDKEFDDASTGIFYAESMSLVDRIGVPVASDVSTHYQKYIDRSTTPISSGLAVYNVTFRPSLYNIKEDTDIDTELDRFVIRSDKPSFDAQPLPFGFLVQKSGQNAGKQFLGAGATYTIPFPKGHYFYRWVKVPEYAYPTNTIDKLEGKVNSQSFDDEYYGAGLGFGSGTLLFHPPNKRKYQGRDGVVYIDVDFDFEYNKNGWQFVPDAKGNFIELARQNDNSIGIFETGNFYDAFNPALG